MPLSLLNQPDSKRYKNYKYFFRGIYDEPKQFDVKFDDYKGPKSTQYDTYLKNFKYKEAILEAIEKKQNDVVISIAEELLQRGELVTPFVNCDE